MATLLLYRASAGTGKTYTLVSQYIKWALHYPDAFKHILAVTFTNQAAQEMKKRIIETLHSLARGETNALQKELCPMGWTYAQLQARSKNILSHIVYQYEYFSVATIDSFFYKIVQSFSKELGLPQHFTIEMDETFALEESVTALLQSDLPLLQKWLVDFSLTKLLAGKRWNVAEELQQLGKALSKESFKLHEQALLISLEHAHTLPNFITDLQYKISSFEERIHKIGKKALAILQREKLIPEDFAYGKKGIIGYFLKIAYTKDFAPTKRVLVGATTIASWLPKKTNKHEHHIQVVTHFLQPLLVEAIDLYVEEGMYYRTAIVVSRFFYSFGVIAALLRELEKYRARYNVCFISDIATLLYRLIQDNDTPFLYEQIGNQFHHFLIDEFQDLSLFQWVNMKPLLQNSLAQGYANLLVGDVKQSIYRWRGSHWKFLSHQVEAEFKETKVYALTANRRSHEAIVSFNNHFFSTAAEQLMRYLEGIAATKESTSLLRYEWEQMKRVYEDAGKQIFSTAQQGGYVELLFLRTHSADHVEEEVSTWKTLVQEEMISLLKNLQQKSMAAKDIVLLVRNHREADLIAHWCNGFYNVREGCMPLHTRSFLWDHVAVKIVIHALYALNNGQDLINTMALIQAYGSCIGNMPIVWHHYLLGDDATSMEALLPKAFWEQKAFLQNLPIYPCVELLIHIFFEKNDAYSAVLSFFQSMLLDYCDKAAEDTVQAFLSWWEKRGKTLQLPVNPNEDAVPIMTIHQAKGLEFKVVVIPFCNWHLDHIPQKGPMLWCSYHQQAPFHYFPIYPLSYGPILQETYYAQDYFLEYMQVHLDNLNLLYVALTRAKEQLYVMAPLPDQVENMVTTADLMYQSLVAHKTEGSGNFSVAEKLIADVQETLRGIKFCFSCM